MLIEFSVANFKSIQDRQTLSLAADKPHKALRNVLKTKFSGAPCLLESLAIYGPNGSGKSNLLLAVEFFRDFVIGSSKDKQEGEDIDVNPFLFSDKTPHQPSEFEIVFTHKGYLFQYGFTVDVKKVHREWLYATPQSSQRQSVQKWFERDGRDYKKNAYIRKEIKGPKKTWLASTRNNALFLSTAVQQGSEEFRIPFEWIQKKLRLIRSSSALSWNFTVKEMQENIEKKNRILKFMKGLDLAFDDLIVHEKEISEDDFKNVPQAIKEEMMASLKGKKRFELISKYSFGGKQEYFLPFEKESDGTKRLLSYAGPILDVLANGYTFVVDELDSCLHPIALRGVLALFQNSKMNKNNAQLIFTTHNTSIMDMMDRDQIWSMDKSNNGATEFISLADFEGRADEAIEKRYLSGRYGVLPNVGDLI